VNAANARRRKPPPRITAGYLERVTAWYLERWATSAGHLRRLLMQRVARSAAHHGTEIGDGAGLVDAEIARLEAGGLLDDAQYAADKVRVLRRRGASAAKVRATLGAKGLGSEGIAEALDDAAEERGGDAELQAAVVYARRHRLGPWRREADASPERRRKELGRLGRAGFPFAVARRVIEAEDPDALEDADGQ
jgi:regulatory protein